LNTFAINPVLVDFSKKKNMKENLNGQGTIVVHNECSQKGGKWGRTVDKCQKNLTLA